MHSKEEDDQFLNTFNKLKKKILVKKTHNVVSSSDFARIVPKTFYQDKEQLYGEVLSLKCTSTLTQASTTQPLMIM